MNTMTAGYRILEQALKHIVSVPKKAVMQKIAAQHKRRKKKARSSPR